MRNMICTCNVDGMREVEERRLRISQRMGLSSGRDLTSAIIFSLAFDFGADGWLDADMWYGVGLKTPLMEGLYIECDHPGDGLAALWEELAEKFPERVSVEPNMKDRHIRITDRISAWLFANYVHVDDVYRAHRVSTHKDNNDCPPCEDCDVFRSLISMTRAALEGAWGLDVLDKAIDKAYSE
jgi:hypothetical protein